MEYRHVATTADPRRPSSHLHRIGGSFVTRHHLNYQAFAVAGSCLGNVLMESASTLKGGFLMENTSSGRVYKQPFGWCWWSSHGGTWVGTRNWTLPEATLDPQTATCLRSKTLAVRVKTLARRCSAAPRGRAGWHARSASRETRDAERAPVLALLMPRSVTCPNANASQ